MKKSSCLSWEAGAYTEAVMEPARLPQDSRGGRKFITLPNKKKFVGLGKFGLSGLAEPKSVLFHQLPASCFGSCPSLYASCGGHLHKWRRVVFMSVSHWASLPTSSLDKPWFVTDLFAMGLGSSRSPAWGLKVLAWVMEVLGLQEPVLELCLVLV